MADNRKKRSAMENRILDELNKLGGERISEDGIRFEGREFILPASMSLREAINFLNEHRKAQDQEQQFSRVYNYRPWDGAHATASALRKLTGTTGIGRAIVSFFGVQPPELRTIKTGPDTTEQVPWGHLEVPLFEGTVQLSATHDEDLGPLFVLGVNAKKKYKNEIEGLFELIEHELQNNSIYKGKAIDGQTDADFISLRGVDPNKVVYADDVRTQLDANIWALLRHTEVMRQKGIPLKRAALLQGQYGTGKTLAGYLTGQIAVENGWTFLYCRPERDDLFEVMQTARLYQPAVVFFEDVDSVSGGDSGVSRLLDVFDGINAKGTEIIAVMTTNHPGEIHKGMIRPGRLDAVIEIGALDEGGVKEMITKYVPEEHRSPDLDFEVISEAMEGFVPAFIRESLDRTLRYSIARNNGEVKTLTTADFVAAATGLRPQLDLMEDAHEGREKPTLDRAFEEVMERQAKAAVNGAGLRNIEYDEVSHRVEVGE
jgi:transitional endoplasmic reticulum ATPase